MQDWAEGHEYEGEWKNDVMSGRGKKIWGGKVYEGIFEKGRLLGLVSFETSNPWLQLVEEFEPDDEAQPTIVRPN